MNPTVFLSHSSIDKPTARIIGAELEKHGLSVWIDECEILPGDSLVFKIAEAIENIDCVCAIISRNSVKSAWVQKELSLAMTKEIEGKRVVVIPVVIDSCNIPFFIRDKLYADYRNGSNRTNELARVAAAARAGNPFSNDSTILGNRNPGTFIHESTVNHAVKSAGNDLYLALFLVFIGLFVCFLTGVAVHLLGDVQFGKAIASIGIGFFSAGCCLLISGLIEKLSLSLDPSIALRLDGNFSYSIPFGFRWFRIFVQSQNWLFRIGLVLSATTLFIWFISVYIFLTQIG
jgi:hypothetical protein